MKAYFSVSELLDFGLPELPKTKVGLGDKIKRENWQFREVAGRGGRGGKKREYMPPPEVQEAIMRQQQEQVLATAQFAALPVAALPDADTAPVADGSTEVQRQREGARLGVLNAIERLMAETKTGRDGAITAFLVSAQHPDMPHLAHMLRLANDKRGGGAALPSKRTIHRWFKQREASGSLLPKVPQKDLSLPEWFKRFAKHLLPLFPEHSCYVELFAGGAALFFMRPERSAAEVLNDINGDLVNLYRVVQHHFDEFVRQFDWTLGSREHFARLQATPPEIMTDIQRAARFFYLQHNAFGGKSAGQTYGTTTTGRTWSAQGIATRLQAAKERLGGVCVENELWQRCLQRYDRPHTFFYADPPYWQTAGYGCTFGWEEYERLAEAMRTMQGKMMLSINDHPDIRALFAGFNLRELQLSYSVGRRAQSRTPKGELVICNY